MARRWSLRLIFVIVSILQPCRSEFLDLINYDSTNVAAIDNTPNTKAWAYKSTWTVELGGTLCVQGLYLHTTVYRNRDSCSITVGTTECFQYTGPTYGSATLVNCGSIICGSNVSFSCPTDNCYVKIYEIDLEVVGGIVTTPATTTSDVPFYYTSSVTLQYADCAEVQAENSAVIEAVGYPFFCTDDYIGFKSCADNLQAGHQETGYYEIDPDGSNTGVDGFLVFCDMCEMTSSTAECPVDYLSYGNSCYKIHSSRVSRSSAASACIAADSHLVDITSQGEQDFLAGQLAGSSDAWIGLTADHTDGPMYWTDGTPLDFEAWDNSGRNDGGTCIRMNDGSNFRWGDRTCSTNYRYVCEFELESSPTSCKGTTVIDHEQLRTDRPQSKNKPGETQVQITYKPSLSQIIALMAVSQNCQQYIKYNCLDSYIWYNGWPYVWWISRHGKDMHNFGGVPTGTEGCACSLTDEGCITQGTNCNCDTLDGNWYIDAGLLSDKETLPVTKLRFGGNDDANYILGPLECNGTETPPKRSCDELWLAGERTDMEYDIDPDGPDGIGPTFKVFCSLSEAVPILRSCEELRLAGYNTDGYYDIDPDEPNFGEPAFTVFCDMTYSTAGETVAGTIVHHDSESRGRVKGYKDKGSFVLTPNYLASSVEQMYHLIGVSEACQQFIQYECSKSKMYSGDQEDKAEAWWATKDGGMMLNWGGVDTGKFGCSCYTNEECIDTGKACNCDKDEEAWHTDGGQLTDKDSLPVYRVYHAHTEDDVKSGWHTLGSLQCSGMKSDLPMYRTCAELQIAGHLRNGSYLLDPDGPDAGDPPFVAYCDMTSGKTYIYHDLPESTNVKRTRNFNHWVNYGATVNQLKQLASLSSDCGQELQFECTYFPLWDTSLGVMKGWWVNVDGQKMNTWAGAALEDFGCKCVDAEPNECPVDFVSHSNSCYKIHSSTVSWSTASSACIATDSHLVYITSQEEQDFLAGQLAGSGDVWIGLTADRTDGPLYWTDGTPLDFEAWDNNGRDAGGTCIRMNDGSNYRWGDISCNRGYGYVCEFELTSTTPSDECSCNCDKDDDVSRSDEGWITDKHFLPVIGLHFDANTRAESEGLVTLGAFQCHGTDTPLLATCDELHNAGYNSSGWYDIDPDGPDMPLSSVRVYCDMITGATIIHHDSEDRRLAISEIGADDAATFRRPVTYKAPMTHITALTQSSLYCKQFIRWDCHNAPIWDSAGSGPQLTYWLSRDGQQMSNWGGVNNGVEGCSCMDDNNGCDENQVKCNCDVDDDVWRYDEGFIVDSNNLPVTELRFGGVNHYLAMGFYTLGPLECFGKNSSIPVLPSCADLRDAGHTSNGYYNIDPDSNGVDIFAVYCDMTTGTTIIGHNREDRGLIRHPDFDTREVDYDVTLDQINALISISSHCQQQLTYDCYGSTLWDTTSVPYSHVLFWKAANMGSVLYNFGIGSGLQGCACSFDGSCANPDGYCNCDAGDFTWRTDTGIITDKSTLPITKIRFGDTNEDKEKGFYTLGRLECNDQEFYSCEELKDAGYVTDGFYEINPDGLVFCNMSQGGSKECYSDPRALDYRGTVAITESGKTCQKWTEQAPHQHQYTPENFPGFGLGDHNYCRNPGNDSGFVWCFTTAERTRWEHCNLGTRRNCAIAACPVYRTDKYFSNKYQYRYPEIPDGVTSIIFSVKAASSAYIALSQEPNRAENGYQLYEIGIGLENNVKTIIRSCVQRTSCNVVEVTVPNQLTQGQYRDFYINFPNGHIQVGRVGAAPFAEFNDLSFTPLPVKYVAFSTADNSEGEWIFPQFCYGFGKNGGKGFKTRPPAAVGSAQLCLVGTGIYCSKQ